MRTVRLLSVLVLAFGLACFVGWPGGEAQAQKKGGGGSTPPTAAPGTIYYSNSNGTSLFASMNGDGTGKVASIGGVPTYQKHGGSRWFLQHYTVDDTGPVQWFAVNESGYSVQLTNDPNLIWNGYPASWTKNDSAFSLCCIYQTETEWIGQLIVTSVVWTNGVPSAGPSVVALELRRPIYDEWGYDLWNDYEVSLGRHDWSPAGDELAISRWAWGTGWIVDVVRFTSAGLESRQLATRMANPVWSPDGTRIAFNQDRNSSYQEIRDLWTINSDGTNLVQLTSYIPGKNYNGTGQYIPTWSPDGAYLAYTERVITSSKRTYTIKRIPSGGGTAVSLTSDENSGLPQWRN